MHIFFFNCSGSRFLRALSEHKEGCIEVQSKNVDFDEHIELYEVSVDYEQYDFWHYLSVDYEQYDNFWPGQGIQISGIAMTRQISVASKCEVKFRLAIQNICNSFFIALLFIDRNMHIFAREATNLEKNICLSMNKKCRHIQGVFVYC